MVTGFKYGFFGALGVLAALAVAYVALFVVRDVKQQAALTAASDHLRGKDPAASYAANCAHELEQLEVLYGLKGLSPGRSPDIRHASDGEATLHCYAFAEGEPVEFDMTMYGLMLFAFRDGKELKKAY